MNSTLFTLLQRIELAKLVIEKEFGLSDEVYGAPQMDMFPEDILKMRIQQVATTLYKMLRDEDFALGIAAMLEAVYLPNISCVDD